jgi:Ankyrin repeats (3 copies)/Ankyrin repeats (many copies)
VAHAVAQAHSVPHTNLIMKRQLRFIATFSIAALLSMLCASCSKSIDTQFKELKASQKSGDDPIIFTAIRSGQADMVEYMIKKREFQLEVTDYFGNTPLLLAAELGDVKIMKPLLAAGANLKVSNKYGAPLIHVVAEKGHVEAMKFLIACGMDINEQDLSGSFTYGPNGTSGFSSEVDSMIRRSGGNPVSGKRPIHVAAQEGNAEMVKFLIASGADPKSKDAEGKTPLDYVDMTRLVEKGDEPKGNRLAVVRIYNPAQQPTPPDQQYKPKVSTNEELQQQFFGK